MLGTKRLEARWLTAVFAAAIALVMTTVPAQSQAQNFIANPGFENGTSGWTLAGDAEAQTVESQGRSGSRLTHWSSASAYVADTRQTVTGLPNGSYRLSVYTVGGASDEAHLYAENCGGADQQVPIPSAAWGSWTQVTLNGIEVSGGNCTIGIRTENSEWTSIDDVTLELVTAASPSSAIEILSDRGFNYARIRLLVDPPNEYALHQDLDYVIATAQEAKANGMNILLDIFYSDWWADPGQNWTPSAWWNMDINTLESTVFSYTQNVLNQMNAAGVMPDLVQVGNEVNPGMCWELGRLETNGWGNFVRLTNAGYDAVKSVSDIPVIIHYAGVGSGATSWYSSYVNNGGKMDAQGLSYYEMWHGSINDAVWTINTLHNTYGQDVYLVETAAYWTNSDAGEQTSYPHTRQGQYDYLYDLTNAVENLNGFAGLFYWGATWTQSGQWLNAPDWQNDDAATRSLFDDNATLTPAAGAIMDAGGLPIMGVDVSEAHYAEDNGVNYQP